MAGEVTVAQLIAGALDFDRLADFVNETGTYTTTGSVSVKTLRQIADEAEDYSNKYLGASASDPTQTAGGGALSAGMLYFRTASPVGMRVYDGSSWSATLDLQANQAETVTGGWTFEKASATVVDPALTIERTWTGATPSGRIMTALFVNTSEDNTATGVDEYKNEVQVCLQAGTTADWRRYFRWLHYDGSDCGIFGMNSNNMFVMFHENGGFHPLRCYPVDAGLGTASGVSTFNSGPSAPIRFNYEPSAECGDVVEIWRGGAVATNRKIYTFEEDSLKFLDATDQGVAQVHFERQTSGSAENEYFLGIGKNNPGFSLDIESAQGSLFRAVSSTMSFNIGAYTLTATQLATQNTDMWTVTSANNSDTRAVVNLLGNSGAVDVAYFASTGKIGFGTATPGYNIHAVSAASYEHRIEAGAGNDVTISLLESSTDGMKLVYDGGNDDMSIVGRVASVDTVIAAFGAAGGLTIGDGVTNQGDGTINAETSLYINDTLVINGKGTAIADVPTAGSATASANATAINAILATMRDNKPTIAAA